MPVTAIRETNGHTGSRFEDVPFASVPGQTKLFLDYLKDPGKLSAFFPAAASTLNELTTHAPEVLAGYTADRSSVCSMLERQNLAFGSESAVFENIKKLKSANCVAVLTGQQAGLFSGPLYTIYKALSAVKAANVLSELGTPAVPIFWIASDDHDFDEVAKALTIVKNGGIYESAYTAPKKDIGKPVGKIPFDGRIEDLIGRLLDEMPRTEFTVELRSILGESYQTGETFSSAFAKMLAKLFSGYGLIIFDPMDTEAKQLVVPILGEAIKRSSSTVEAVRERSRKLESAGYHSQVLIEENYFPLFWFDETGIRRSLKKKTNGTYQVTDTKHAFTIDKLLNMIDERPEQFSPGVMLRPVVQDFLFPTICYIGGGAEISYFAQNSEVYRILERRPSAIFPRNSFTIVDPKHSRSLKRYGLTFEKLFAGNEVLVPFIVDKIIDPETNLIFADAEERINKELDKLEVPLSHIDPTLAESLTKRKQKIIYHIGVLRKKARRASLERDEIIHRQITSLFNSLLPNNGLQERALGILSFLNFYGPELIDWLYDSVDLDNKDHRVLYL